MAGYPTFNDYLRNIALPMPLRWLAVAAMYWLTARLALLYFAPNGTASVFLWLADLR